MPATVPAPIVLLVGPPGVGKSTVGRLVAAAFERSVHIEADVVRESIVGGFVEPGTPDFTGEPGIEQFALQREIVIEWALRKAAAGYVPVIDDAALPPDGHFERQYAPLLDRPGTRPILLTAEAEVIRERIRSRGGAFDDLLVTVVDRALALHDVLTDGVWQVVDSTDRTVDEAASEIVEHVHRSPR